MDTYTDWAMLACLLHTFCSCCNGSCYKKNSHVLEFHQMEMWSALVCKYKGFLVVFQGRGTNGSKPDILPCRLLMELLRTEQHINQPLWVCSGIRGIRETNKSLKRKRKRLSRLQINRGLIQGLALCQEGHIRLKNNETFELHTEGIILMKTSDHQ